jgi:parvulin-like peptidyl-prolyl isomerase
VPSFFRVFVASHLALALCIPLLFPLLHAADNPVMAIAGPDTLRRRELVIQLRLQGETEVTPENVQPLLEHWGDRALLYQEAAREGLGADETTRALVYESERQYLITLLTKRLTDTVSVSNNEIYDYYNRRKNDFSTRLRFQYMVLEDEKAAKQVLAELKQGKDFKLLAQERSLDRAKNPSAEAVLAGRADTLLNLDPLLEDTIFIFPVGKVSPPLKAGNSYWLVKPLERTPLGMPLDRPDQTHDYVGRIIELKRKRAVLEKVIAACRKKNKVVPTPPRGDTTGFLASVGGSILTRHYLELQLPAKTEFDEQDIPRLVSIWSKAELLYQEARRLHLGEDDSTRVYLSEKRRDYITNLLLDRLLAKVSVPGTEVFDYFQAHKNEFLDDVRVLHILVGSESLAGQVLAELKTGADFSTLSKERSYDRHVAQGAESRYLSRLDPNKGLDVKLEAAIFQLKPGEVSPIIHTQEGYWIVKVTDRKRVRKDVTLEQANDAIRQFLFESRSRQLIEELLTRLRKEHPVTIFPGNFWS